MAEWVRGGFLVAFMILNLWLWLQVLTGVHSEDPPGSSFAADVRAGAVSMVLGIVAGLIGVGIIRKELREIWLKIQEALAERRRTSVPWVRRTDNCSVVLGLAFGGAGLAVVLAAVTLPFELGVALTALGLAPPLWAGFRQVFNPKPHGTTQTFAETAEGQS